ncbi:MAG: YcxB family protein [Defluviitaleaceae bacterium]|nr:YcxB family protein [Defluviitaleaceae bacterium]
MYKFEYILEEMDYVEFNRHVFYKSPVQRKNMMWMRFGVALIPLLMLPLAVRFLESGAMLWLSCAFLVILSLGWIFLFKKFLTRLFKRLVGKLDIVFGQKISVIFDGKNIIEKTELGENRSKYESIREVSEEHQGKSVYVFIDDIRAVILPARAFESDAQKEEFIKHIKQK